MSLHSDFISALNELKNFNPSFNKGHNQKTDVNLGDLLNDIQSVERVVAQGQVTLSQTGGVTRLGHADMSLSGRLVLTPATASGSNVKFYTTPSENALSGAVYRGTINHDNNSGLATLNYLIVEKEETSKVDSSEAS